MQQTIDVDRQLVFYTQQTFRELLNGMARPGKIHQMRPFPLARGQFSQAETFLVGIGFTLLDVEVSFAVHPEAGYARLAEELNFLTRARQTTIFQADYIFATAWNRPDFLTDLRRGELERPDLGATVIMSVDYLSACQAKPDGAGLSLQLKGPGILNQNQIYLGGPLEEHWRLVAAANAEFPSGIDLILVCAGQFCCLPRTTTIEVGRER